ncbi:MAG: M48 family metalloprotease [Halieaceae bacterium]|jgi:predicted Zn-dependent protease|nr:M48 family metalloprotease [Halieaceae bacterium]
MSRSVAVSALAGALITLMAGCAGNPATGGSSVVLSSQGREISIGEDMHQQIVEQGAIYEDPELAAYVNRVGQRLVQNSDAPGDTFTFTVIDSPDINAFATPGGFVYVNRGLLAYLDNEAELAGVMAHEIGHVTARHAARQQTASITNQVVATTAYILTGSGELADASNMYGTELVRGYGREHELEADGLGAKYMYNAGYDPDSLLEVIGVLKDQEQFQRVKAKSTGKPVASYHGLYATHPRNDQRLQTVIRTAGDLGSGETMENPEVAGEFRRQIEGLVWGPSVQSARDENRYYHNKLGFSFEHPPGWQVTAGAKAIVASARDGSVSLTLTIRRREQASSPRAVLESSATGGLAEGAELDQAGLTGYTAVAASGSDTRRLAVIDYGNLSYLFDGRAANFAAADPQLLAAIQSFRPIHPRERQAGNGYRIHYIQVPRGATMASLASSVRIPDAEGQLRLLNGLYPRGEPRTGDWIKIIR